MDPTTGTFADAAKVHAIDFEGTYYRSRGPLNTTPSPQGRPVIIQAGASDRGQDFAARHAEAVIVARETVDEMKQYYDAFKARVKGQGRDPDECKVFFLTKPIIAGTDEAAQQRAGRGRARVTLDDAADRSLDLRPRSAVPAAPAGIQRAEVAWMSGGGRTRWGTAGGEGWWAEGFLLPRCYHSIRPQGEPGLSAVRAPSRCLARLGRPGAAQLANRPGS
jgi:alkanesulfonate monooxygenase SsuD/methylene tetrahydromethanopterin reductase-like flavin-dependent oxidoreductase (luciferase family)